MPHKSLLLPWQHLTVHLTVDEVFPHDKGFSYISTTFSSTLTFEYQPVGQVNPLPELLCPSSIEVPFQQTGFAANEHF